MILQRTAKELEQLEALQQVRQAAADSAELMAPVARRKVRKEIEKVTHWLLPAHLTAESTLTLMAVAIERQASRLSQIAESACGSDEGSQNPKSERVYVLIGVVKEVSDLLAGWAGDRQRQVWGHGGDPQT